MATDVRAPEPAAIAVEGLHVAYLQKEILKGAAVTVGAGEVVCLVGANGAGKSTLLKAITGLLPIRQGKVHLLGTDVTHRSPLELAGRGLGYLLQESAVFPTLSSRENLELAAAVRNGRSPGAAVDEALGRFPLLSPFLSRRAGLLSGGERRLLSIAMTLAQAPRALLLDEPSAGLAPRLARPALAILREYAQSQGAPCLLVEQNLRLGIDHADRVYLMSDGVAREIPIGEVRSDRGLLARLMFPRSSEDPFQGGAL